MLNSGDWDTYPPEGSGDRSLVLSATKLDAKEEAELRILVTSSLRSDESDRSEYSSDSSTAAIDTIDEEKVAKMQLDIERALDLTYKSPSFQTMSPVHSTQASNELTAGTGGPSSSADASAQYSQAYASEYYSDMDDSDESNSSGGASRSTRAVYGFVVDTDGEGSAAPPQVPAGSPFAAAVEGSMARNEGITLPNVEAAGSDSDISADTGAANYYSDMNSEGDSNSDDDYVYQASRAPILRSLELQPLARRSEEALVGGRNQDYIALARMYKVERPYSDPHGSPACVLCHQAPSRHVFFPCEHRCVCPACMRSEGFCEDDNEGKTGYSLCPLCACSIKKILPHDGREVQRYWQWVEEVSPSLPPGFVRSFKHSAGALKKVYVQDGDLSDNVDGMCNPS